MDKLRNYLESSFNVFFNEMDMPLCCTLCAHFQSTNKSVRGNGRQYDGNEMKNAFKQHTETRQDILSYNFGNEIKTKMKTKTKVNRKKSPCEQITHD